MSRHFFEGKIRDRMALLFYFGTFFMLENVIVIFKKVFVKKRQKIGILYVHV